MVFATAWARSGHLVDDWNTAADPEATLAIYMGAGQADAVFSGLIAAGCAASTPEIIIENAGRAGTRHVTGTLATLVDAIEPGMTGPVLIVVGDAASRGALQHAPAIIPEISQRGLG